MPWEEMAAFRDDIFSDEKTDKAIADAGEALAPIEKGVGGQGGTPRGDAACGKGGAT